MRSYIMSFLILMTLFACDEDFKIPNEESSQLVVEGWIENGEFPIVILTRSVPASTEYQNKKELYNYLIRWSKVSVSNGTDTIILTGKYDDGYFPPYIYTTSRMRGEAGKQYTLSVEYRDYRATAKTTIPKSFPNCTFKVESSNWNQKTVFLIKTILKDNIAEKNYYQLFTCLGNSSKQYQASYLGSIDDAMLDSITEIPIYKGHKLTLDEYRPHFTYNDTVSIKVAQIDETSFRIWDSYVKTLSLSSNMFLSTSTDMESNIDGGYGYWCGYNSTTHHVILFDSIYHFIYK